MQNLYCLWITNITFDCKQDSDTGRWRAHMTKQQGTPRRQPKQCNNWTAYPSGVTTPELSSVQTRRKHCGECLTTEQQANQCQWSHLKELFVKRTSHLRYFGIHFDWMLTYRKHVSGNTVLTCKKGLSVLKAAVSKCDAHCHWLWTKPHNSGSARAQSRAILSHTGSNQGHIHWDHEVHATFARPSTNANQTEGGAGQSILQCCRKSS